VLLSLNISVQFVDHCRLYVILITPFGILNISFIDKPQSHAYFVKPNVSISDYNPEWEDLSW
jgi:hypothetical protein